MGERKEQIEELTDKRDTKNKGKKEMNWEKGEIHGLNNNIYIKQSLETGDIVDQVSIFDRLSKLLPSNLLSG